MPAYIDYTYYTDDFHGAEVDEQEFKRMTRRASDVIDQVTGYKIVHIGLDNLSEFIVEQVKKATAAQVEHYVIAGGVEFVGSSGVTSAQAGNFQYQTGGGQDGSGDGRVSPDTIDYLRYTGLLYSGIGTMRNVY
ncbi:hypothetical protein [Salipaludibacillus aurantiacus]|uniref:Uncharacterized protein n=1 Tax=Salipaludibacillus aurantiacus TaxID=1601833 RepID=A0A1H9TZS5_9BACI|nr:hypothetical protein [Salipaludibacillus aurantiacus]SES02715.1 hypothetical protein SAMN05518684_106202 [Salipaludibacillus aurantiacus]